MHVHVRWVLSFVAGFIRSVKAQTHVNTYATDNYAIAPTELKNRYGQRVCTSMDNDV